MINFRIKVIFLVGGIEIKRDELLFEKRFFCLFVIDVLINASI